jgi:hypothetical protein
MSVEGGVMLSSNGIGRVVDTVTPEQAHAATTYEFDAVGISQAEVVAVSGARRANTYYVNIGFLHQSAWTRYRLCTRTQALNTARSFDAAGVHYRIRKSDFTDLDCLMDSKPVKVA